MYFKDLVFSRLDGVSKWHFDREKNNKKLQKQLAMSILYTLKEWHIDYTQYNPEVNVTVTHFAVEDGFNWWEMAAVVKQLNSSRSITVYFEWDGDDADTIWIPELEDK